MPMQVVADALGNIVEGVGKAVEDVVYFAEDVGNNLHQHNRANALENTETIKKSQKSKKSLQKEEKKVCYY